MKVLPVVSPTHRVAACAYVFDPRGALLLLRRTRPPRCWAPPGGRLEPDEDPVAGLQREVREEAGLEIEVLGLAGAWFGATSPGRPPLLGLDYVAACPGGPVQLSEEHDAAAWATAADLAAGRYPSLDEHGDGYRPEELALARELYEFHRRRRDRQGADKSVP